MAAAHALPASPPTYAMSDEIKHEFHQTPAPLQAHTPPTTDEASHKDDDAASSSSLSDLDETVNLDVNMEDFDEEINRQRFEDAARAGAEAEKHSQIKPHHYEGGVPVFQPTMDEFRDFQAFMAQADAYGMQSGIIKIVPPDEWKAARKALDDLVKHIKIKNPITQEFHGAQGVYTQRNMEKIRSYNLPQWKATCEQTENQPPARRGEKRMNADKLLGRGSTRGKKTEGTPTPENGKRRGRPPKKRDSTIEPESSLAAPPTPTSPEVKPVVVKIEDEEREETPGPAKKGRKTKGRQPKNATKREGGGGKSTETTVAARRLRNAREAVDVVDEEAFKDFDYRIYDHDQWTGERCEELEDKYWKSLNFSNPMYAADMPGSLFDEDTKEWNVAKLPNLLDLLGAPIPGVNTAYLYLGMWRATFAWHLEDVDLYSINYIHFGAPKQWYSISQKDAPKFENAMKSIWPSDAKNCDQFLRHKTYLVSPSILKSKYGVEVNKVVHREGEFVVTFPIGYHSGYNLGYNCAESVNFAIENWLNYGKTARKCQCEADSVFIDVDWFVRKMNGEPSPEYEEVEITDDEDDLDDALDLPTPPGSEVGRGRGKSAQKRKRPAKEAGPNKKAKKIVRIRKVSKNQPCCLCPNDFAWEELLPTTNNQRAHRVCAMYTPETYIATEDGAEKVFNVENISKARLDLRCHECKQKKGSCFQCSSAKCTRAYHATCAMHAGVQVDKGEIAIWHDGVEYRDIGFDWRCKLHRTVKRTRITSELSTMNHATDWLDNKELHKHIISLMPGDVIQWQAFHGDEIQAGVVKQQYDPGQNSLLVSVLPEQRVVREVDPAWILFVDSSTSCLQRPSANALDLPEELQGKTAQVPGSTEKKPSEGDPFTENPKTEWAEFVVEPPPHNKWQKKADLNKDKQLFYYLGKTSTDTKAQYTADARKPIHDPASNFLDSVEPTRMAPPPQPKRHSLAASYPMISFAARNATVQSMRQQTAPKPVTIKPETFTQERVLELDRSGYKQSQYHDQTLAAEARANEQARILQRQQASRVQYEGQGSFPSNIGVDQNAVARQKQFQLQASQQSRSMSVSSHSPQTSPPLPLYTTHSSMTAYRPYHNIAPNYYNDPPRYGYTPQSMQFTHDWMNPPGRSPTFPSPAMPTMESNSPELAFKQPATFTQSPTTLSHSTTYPSPSTQPPSQNQSQSGSPFLGDSAVSRGAGGTNHVPVLKKESSSMDSARTASTLLPPRTPTEAERQRRISNPSWPFKSPEQILAQKGEREKNGSQSSGSRPVSRPGSGYSTKAFPSPRIHAMPYGPEPQPPMYINPTATQLTPSTGHGHSRAKSMSVSAGVGKMGPPMQYPAQPFRRSMSSSNLVPMDLDIKPNLADLRHDLVSRPFGPMPPPTSRSRRSTMTGGVQPSIDAPIAPPSPELESSLESRPTTRSGTPVNDRPPPEVISSWQSHPASFWGKIANYFSHKHESAATVYKSAFGVGSNSDLTTCGLGFEAGLKMQGASSIGNDAGLAGRWLGDLENDERVIVEQWKGEHPTGMRP